MNKEKTLEYIKQAIDLESSVVEQREIINTYDEFSKEQMPVLKLEEGTKEPQPKEEDYSMRLLMAFLILMGLVIFGVVIASQKKFDIGGAMLGFICSALVLLIPIKYYYDRTKEDKKFLEAEQHWHEENLSIQAGESG